MWRKTYPYLNDADFLIKIDTQHLQNYHIKLTLLDWDENPLQEIQGIATGGSISYNGDSAVRRTCSLSMTVKQVEDGQISDTANLISINKKVFLEVGIENKTNKFKTEYPIVWFPQGLFVFTQCTVNSSIGAPTTLSAQLKDKMCLLNGECGGVIPATVQFDRWDTIDADGNWITEKPTIATIVREAVNHWGGEQLGKILIADIDEKVKQRIRWLGNDPLYLINKQGNYFLTTDKSQGSGAGIQTFEYGDDIGFIYTDFIYPEELIANPGDNIVTAVLEKIKNFLGNFEFFYDVYGNFRFQEIKDFLNTTQATVEINKLKNEDYRIDIAKGKAVYDFTNNKLATSFSNTPQYTRIKNDFVIWGARKGANDIDLPIRYHLAIDKKPKIGNIYDVYFYIDPDDKLRKAKVPIKFQDKSRFPEVGNVDLFYMDENSGVVYKWDAENKEYTSLSGKETHEYPTVEDFPAEPAEDDIYIALDTKDTYRWLPNINSDHYKEYQDRIDELTAEYEEAAVALQSRIKIIKGLIEEIKNDMTELDMEYKPYLDELESYTQDVDNLENTITSYETTIEEYNTVIEGLRTQLQELDILYDEYQTKAIQAETPEEADYWYNLANEVQAKMVIIEERIETIQQEIVDTEDSITFAQEKISEFQTYINEVNAKLEEYYTQMNLLNNEYERFLQQLQELEDALAALTAEYEENLAKLKYLQNEYIKVSVDTLVKVQTTDWRSELYLQGVAAEALGLASNYYYAELKAEWPKLYNLTANSYTDSSGHTIYTGDFYEGVLEHPWDLDYWLDFIDSDAAIGKLSIKNIGRRTLSENKDDYNYLFEPEVPDFIIIESGQDDTEEKRQECEKRSQKYIQVDPGIFALIGTGIHVYGCFERVKECLYDYTSYNNSVSISCLPIYHLEPNTRITITSTENDIHGDHLIKSMSVPLTIEGTMTISAVQCNAKL